jgi:hypothetical protein|tara:strand:+ start:21901 stop:22905 length:1005 start_codon:yes stop_codon:yes gene_type:complete
MKKSLVLLIIAIPLLFSCRKKEGDKYDGPSLNDVYGSFSVITPLSADKDSVDFAAGQTLVFSAALSKIAEWTITITGQSSGAVKRIEGTSSIIDASVATWIGNTSDFPMFKEEVCDVKLSFTGETDTLTTTVKIINPKLNPGFLVSDFETGMNPGWSTFIQSGADMDFQIKTDATAAQGNSYYNMAGTVDWDWLIGYLYFPASAYGAPQYPLASNPDNVYFNLLIYGEPGMVNTLLLFQFQEDEDGNGGFSGSSEDMYSLEIPVNWAGWKMVSIKYSDIPCLVNGQPSAPSGNGQHNPDKLQQINMLDLANPISGNAKTKVDYIIFTENAPLNP